MSTTTDKRAAQATPMNPDVKARWVAALRSGEYGQCQGRLADGKGGYCCLGVLAKVEGDLVLDQYADGPDERWAVPDGYGGFNAYGLERNQAMKYGLDWDGLYVHPAITALDSGKYETPNTQLGIFAALNDRAEWSFAQIADYIEENF